MDPVEYPSSSFLLILNIIITNFKCYVRYKLLHRIQIAKTRKLQLGNIFYNQQCNKKIRKKYNLSTFNAWKLKKKMNRNFYCQYSELTRYSELCSQLARIPAHSRSSISGTGCCSCSCGCGRGCCYGCGGCCGFCCCWRSFSCWWWGPSSKLCCCSEQE